MYINFFIYLNNKEPRVIVSTPQMPVQAWLKLIKQTLFLVNFKSPITVIKNSE